VDPSKKRFFGMLLWREVESAPATEVPPVGEYGHLSRNRGGQTRLEKEVGDFECKVLESGFLGVLRVYVWKLELVRRDWPLAKRFRTFEGEG